MNTEDLQNRKVAIEQRFDELLKVKSNADDEMKRLQGEYRLLTELLPPDAPVKPKRIRKVPVQTDATN